MNWEIILSIISLAITLTVGVLTLVINHRISKINNTKDLHTYQKHITQFELQFRDEDWLYDLIINKDEFDHYDPSSKKRIANWFAKYAKKYPLKKLKIIDVDTPTQPVEEVKEEKPTEVQADKEEPKEEKPVEPKKTNGKNKQPRKSHKRKQTMEEMLAARLRPDRFKVEMVNTDLDKAIAEARLRSLIGSQGPQVVIREVEDNKPVKAARVITTIEDEFDGE